MTTTAKRSGMVRLDEHVRREIDEYAKANGISYNAAMNILVRAGLRATSTIPSQGATT